MSPYDVSRYLPIVGAMGLLLPLGLEWTGVSRRREAEAADEGGGSRPRCLGALPDTRGEGR